MKRTWKISIATTTLVVGAVLSGATIFSNAAGKSETYSIDPVHSMAIFRVKHMNVSYTYGRINNPTGTIVFNEADPSKSSVKIELKAANVDTDNAKRDGHLKNPDFFNAKQHPVITFESTKVEKAGENTYNVTGNFTLLGTSKSITVPVTHTGSGKHPKSGAKMIGFESVFTIKRSDFGMKYGLPMVGDDIRIILSLECNSK